MQKNFTQDIVFECSRPSMRAVFEDKQAAKQRASVETLCLPSLPGPKFKQEWHKTAISLSDPQEIDLDNDQNDGHHQGNTQTPRSSSSFDIQSITRYHLPSHNQTALLKKVCYERYTSVSAVRQWILGSVTQSWSGKALIKCECVISSSIIGTSD